MWTSLAGVAYRYHEPRTALGDRGTGLAMERGVTGVVLETITSRLTATSSIAMASIRSTSPAAHRRSIFTFLNERHVLLPARVPNKQPENDWLYSR